MLPTDVNGPVVSILGVDAKEAQCVLPIARAGIENHCGHLELSLEPALDTSNSGVRVQGLQICD
jgi:hypothetical protein